MIPRVRLETERLCLRPPTMEDLGPLASFYADPEVMRYVGTGRTVSREQTAESIRRMMGRWDEDGFGMFFVDRKEDAALIGRVGILVWETATWTPTTVARAGGPVELEIGYTLGREFWGRGYATEAAIGVRDHAIRELGAKRLISMIRPDNAASKGVARKVGMTYERTVELLGGPAELFALEWPGTRAVSSGERR